MVGLRPNNEGKLIRLSYEQSEVLASLVPTSEYWSNVQDFLVKNLNCALCTLTEKQQNWYFSILASLDKEIDKEIAKELFDE